MMKLQHKAGGANRLTALNNAGSGSLFCRLHSRMYCLCVFFWKRKESNNVSFKLQATS